MKRMKVTSLPGQMVGLGDSEIAFDYVQQREQFAKPVVEFEVMQDERASIEVKIEAARVSSV